MSEIIEKKGVKVTIVEHEGGSEEFHVMEEKINEYLKEIAGLCGIDKNITFHVARHKEKFC